MQWYDRVLIVALIVVVSLSTTMYLTLMKKGTAPSVTVIGVPETHGAIQLPKIKVHVKGAVRKPGVYEFNAGARVEDAVKKAEALPKADVHALNLAAFLKDGDEVFVPDRSSRALEAFEEALTIRGAEKIAPTYSRRQKQPPIGKVAINRATAKQLESLPGIGPALAERIVEYRQAHGPFKSVDELLNVRGIGKKKLEALRPYVKLW
jgi:competence protein ComEA